MKVITIGRSSENDVVINDPHTSRHHMQIIQHDDGHYSLSDFGSTNGTFVNGQKVNGEVILRENDVVRIGNTIIPWIMYFEAKSLVDPPKPPDLPIMPVQKQGAGFVLFWLWLMIVANIGGGIFHAINAQYATWLYATSEKAELFFYVKHGMVDYYTYATYFMIALSLVNALGAILLLNWKKIGYWLFVGSSAACFAIMVSFAIIGGFTIAVGASMFGAIAGPIILWAILQIKKNEVCCWKQLV